MLLGFQFPNEPFHNVWLNGSVIAAAALLMVSRIPTFSLKGRQIPQRYVLPLLLLFSLLVGFAIEAPWATLTVVMFVYIATIPVSLITHRRRQHKLATEFTPT